MYHCVYYFLQPIVAVLGLRGYERAFSSAASGDYSLVAVWGLVVVASLVAEHRL